ncbi:retrotransposon protein, putative, ty1-copia subclass, partial [Tanacetum coccineum]
LDSTLFWHCLLRHISKKRIKKLQHDGLLNSTNIKSFEKYVSCMSGKMTRKPYSDQVERAKYLLGLIHTDVCGLFRTVSRQGASYFVTFTDDFSRYGYVYLLKHKHEVFETFKVFQKEVENQLGKTIKSLHSDRGGEYMSQEFLDHLKEHGIIAHQTPPYMPQHNGVSERRNRTLLDMGCETLVKRDTLTKPDNLEPRSIKCIFVGYPKETMGYSFYYPLKNKIFVAQNAEFFENSLITQEAKVDEPQCDINPIRKSTRTRRALDRMCLHVDAEEHELGDLGKPANYKAALLDPESDKWLDAMNVEMQSMKDNDVWDLVDLPSDGKTVGSKWLFKKKTDMDGAVHTFKARLVAKGFTQTYGVDYEETFSPVANIRAIRILIAIATFYVYEICQNRDEPYVYMKASGSYVTFLILYVDDILMMGNNIPMLQDVKSYLGRCFAMKDLGEAAYILGIKIYQDRSKRLIGELHWTTVKNILKYLRNTKDMFLVYGGDMKRELRVSCYTDAGYVTDTDDLKS